MGVLRKCRGLNGVSVLSKAISTVLYIYVYNQYDLGRTALYFALLNLKGLIIHMRRTFPDYMKLEFFVLVVY
jgi:hypothetical protein